MKGGAIALLGTEDKLPIWFSNAESCGRTWVPLLERTGLCILTHLAGTVAANMVSQLDLDRTHQQAKSIMTVEILDTRVLTLASNRTASVQCLPEF